MSFSYLTLYKGDGIISLVMLTPASAWALAAMESAQK
jgi:hypothetical protein